jgi:molybdopterin converting factor small subunit
VTVRIVAFASARELLAGRTTLELPEQACAVDAWARLVEDVPELLSLRGVRFAVAGSIVPPDWELQDGDEFAVLPAVGGG